MKVKVREQAFQKEITKKPKYNNILISALLSKNMIRDRRHQYAYLIDQEGKTILKLSAPHKVASHV